MPDRRHEPDATNVRGVLLTAAGLAFAVAAVMAGLWMWWQAHPQGEPAEAMLEARPPSSPSPLEKLPAIREALYGEQRERLQSYGWVDETQGIAHIPVTDAMEHMAHGGWPVFETRENESAQP